MIWLDWLTASITSLGGGSRDVTMVTDEGLTVESLLSDSAMLNNLSQELLIDTILSVGHYSEKNNTNSRSGNFYIVLTIFGGKIYIE